MASEPAQPATACEVVPAPVDGSGLYLGHRSLRVLVPATGLVVEFDYVTEPPHGDALLEMRVQGRRFPGAVWGATTLWSADGRLLVMEGALTFPKAMSRTCVLVDLGLWRYVVLDGFRPVSIHADGLAGRTVGGAARTIRPDHLAGWQAA